MPLIHLYMPEEGPSSLSYHPLSLGPSDAPVLHYLFPVKELPAPTV